VVNSGFLGTGRFTVRRRLGAGGMGVVYEAFDRVWQQTVALKTLARADPSAISRLKTEFRSLADISHPNLVSLYELFIEEDLCFFTMELVDGVDFLSYVEAASEPRAATSTMIITQDTDPDRTLSQTARVSLSKPANRSRSTAEIGRLRAALRQLAEGLCALHEAQKLHRDIKPSNIMVTAQGRVAILDFGLATELAKSNPTHTLKFAGTPAYMSPEQGLDQSLTPASDWYGVGVTLYQSLTGKLPFSDSDFIHLMLNKQTLEAVPPSELAEGIPDDLDSLCRALLRSDPQGRPSGREVLQCLGAGLAAEAVRFDPGLSAARSLPFVGREHHLAQLRDAFGLTKSGRTSLVYIHGSSGMGKTLLVRRFLEELQGNEKVIVLEGRCYEREWVPYKALDGIIDSLSRCLRSMPEHQTAALMPRDVHALSRLFPVMLRVDSVANAPYRSDETTDPLNLRSRACSAMRELFARISDRQPLVLFIDDLHWADADSMTLIEDLLRPPGEPSLLLLVGFRSEEAESTAFLKTFLERIDPRQGRELKVGPLTGTESNQLVAAMLDSSLIGAQKFAADIVREGDGSPFFLEQLARWTLSNKAAAGTASISLDEMLNGRIEPLPAGAKALLETLAVAAAPLDTEVACLAAGIDSVARPLISSMRVANFIRSTGVAHRLEIYHDRIREHLASNIDSDATARIHLSIAAALESKCPDDPEALFEHYLRGGNRERASGYAVLAARKSADAVAFDRAAMFYRDALDLASQSSAERIVLKTGLAKALANAGRPAERRRCIWTQPGKSTTPRRLTFSAAPRNSS
jgi:serine/threonine protein kinase